MGKNVHITNGSHISFGNHVQIRPDVDLFAGDKMTFGNYCDVGVRNRFNGDMIIEDSVLFGPDNYITSVDHNYQDVNIPIIDQRASTISKYGHSELRIGEGSWIGTHVAIIGCVHIGKHCVIGANTVITKDVPDYSVVVGNPARIVKQYDLKEKKWSKISTHV